ncbi:protein FAM13A-like isoform X2 [Argiope bruennichi]|uniref:protein FAM13A-like isoform X2 n=1 Tax=Argiope bruennichi TaxID=94029 RepID=UPI002493E48E|nr:protein FAM13A-like isoform X2 [Argiope bruennichi]
MRAPFCNDSPDLSPEEKGIICHENEDEREIHSIERSLARSHTNKTAVFGICLDDLMGTTAQVTPQIPFILSRLCRYIETHGLCYKNLFLEGDVKSVVENLKGEFSECGDASLEAVHDIASVARLLLMFFEELPEPLIPRSAQSDFITDMEKLSLNSNNCISHLKHIVEKLPDSAYQVLKYLSRFLLRVACHEEYNGMNCESLAIIFGPILFRPSSKDPSLLTQLKNIVKRFVQDYHDIFEDDAKSSIYEDLSKYSTKVCRQLPCPSAVMPVVPLSPLSVVIPSMDTSTDRNVMESVPALLIEGPIEPTEGNKMDVNLPNTENKGVTITRKRKERRFSGEDSQPRSSSEERPNTNGLLSLENIELMRRCNSHEEVMEDIKINGKMSTSSKHIRESVDNWKYQPSKCSEKLASSDMPLCRDSQQHPTAEFLDKNTMECDASEDHGTMNAEEEFMESKSGITRPASCPVPKTENDRENSESESSSLSLSWSMLFEDSEPIRSSLLWSNNNQDEALLSPSVHELRSTNYYEAPLSPSAYRSYLSHRGPHLDPSVPPSPPVEQEDFAKKLVESSGISDSIKQFTKKIHSIKKRIRKFDEKFEAEFGYKPSHAEKSNNAEAKKLLNDLYKARKELKNYTTDLQSSESETSATESSASSDDDILEMHAELEEFCKVVRSSATASSKAQKQEKIPFALKEEAHLEQVSPASVDWHASQRSHVLGDSTNHFLREDSRDKTKPSIEVSLEITLKTLAEERKNLNRPELIDDMTNEQVKEEKVAIQKALLHLESIHGKPYTKDERNSMRPLYDRYRNVKKLVRSTSFPGSILKKKDLCGELQPILEHETMEFPSREVRIEKDILDEEAEPEKAEIIAEGKLTEEPMKADEKKSAQTSGILTMKYDNSNFHELPLSELIFQLQKVKSEKRHLRKILKEFETEFLRLNGRKVQKEDKAPVDAIYNEYKHVKARLKLLEALISKHDQHQLM